MISPTALFSISAWKLGCYFAPNPKITDTKYLKSRTPSLQPPSTLNGTPVQCLTSGPVLPADTIVPSGKSGRRHALKELADSRKKVVGHKRPTPPVKFLEAVHPRGPRHRKGTHLGVNVPIHLLTLRRPDQHERRSRVRS